MYDCILGTNPMRPRQERSNIQESCYKYRMPTLHIRCYTPKLLTKMDPYSTRCDILEQTDRIVFLLDPDAQVLGPKKRFDLGFRSTTGDFLCLQN